MSFKVEPRILFTGSQISAAVKKLADEISRDYQGRYPLLVGVLTGSFVFMADLIRMLKIPIEVDFMKISSYGEGIKSTGKPRILLELHSETEGRDILVIEDIIDTGLTTSVVLDYIRARKPASLKLCSLTDKPARRKVQIPIDYVGFSVPNQFLVGYGLDMNGKYRNLPGICVIETEDAERVGEMDK